MQYCFKKINIEAPFETTQCGHSCQTYLVSEFKDHLFARVLGLKEESNWIIHISLDLLAFDAKHRLLLQEQIQDYYQNNNIHLFTSATHTHYANSVRDDRYVDWLMKQLYEGIISMEYIEKGNIYTSYQRKHTNAVGRSRISDYESGNENLCLVRFYDEESNFFTMVINNCHPTTLSAMSTFFSSEYPGNTLKMLEDNNPECQYSFIQGASGDISSRFVRDGQEYQDMIKLAENLFIEIKEMLKINADKTPLTLKVVEKNIDYEHDLSPVDISKLRPNLSKRELETIELGQQQRAKLKNPSEKSLIGKPIKNITLTSWNLGSIKIIFYPNEIFSAYLDLLDLDKEMLVSYSNGYGPYILPIDFPYVTYEMFMDTLSDKTKNDIMQAIKTI